MAGLFAYYFVSNSLREGVKSVTKGGQLILNTAFPRALLPLSSVITSFMRFVPTVIIYAPVHVVAGLPVGPQLPVGVAARRAVRGARGRADDVRRRGRRSTSATSPASCPTGCACGSTCRPVLYYASEVPERYKWLLDVNPLAPLLTAWSEVLNAGHAPSAGDARAGHGLGGRVFVAGGALLHLAGA